MTGLAVKRSCQDEIIDVRDESIVVARAMDRIVAAEIRVTGMRDVPYLLDMGLSKSRVGAGPATRRCCGASPNGEVVGR
jgi:hypothetical protein